MVSLSFLSLLSAIVSVFAILTVLSIFKKVYDEEYKRPWLYIGTSGIFLGTSQVLRYAINNTALATPIETESITLLLEFIGICFLSYGLFQEYWILKYYKGKFVKMKFVPVQEGTLGGEIDLNVVKGHSYITMQKEQNYLLNRFSEAIKKGFQGFLISEANPKEIRTKYKIYKTPIAWINQLENSFNSDYLKEFLDENSDAIDPIQLNNLISYIDNFLEQSMSPFIMLDLDFILKVNNYNIVEEFLQYVNARVKKYDAILICVINKTELSAEQQMSIRTFMTELQE